MTNEDIKNNYNLCIKWLKDNADKIGNEPLYIGWGKRDFNHPWLEKEYESYDHNVEIGEIVGFRNLNVSIHELSGYYEETYGYERDFIEKWEKSYEGTGMRCPHYKHTFEDIGICDMEIFLKQWKTIKGRVLERISEVKSLDNFEV